MEKENRGAGRSRRRIDTLPDSSASLRAVTDGEFKKRKPADLSMFLPPKRKLEQSVEEAQNTEPVQSLDETQKTEDAQAAGEKSDGLIETILGALQGEFNDSPTTPQLFLDLSIGMVPVLGEATDLRDMTATFVRMVSSGVYNNGDDWLSLGLSSIGLVPLVGGFLKGFAKVGRAGKLTELVDSGDEFAALIARFNLSPANFHSQLMALWNGATGQAVGKFNQVLTGINNLSLGAFRGKIASIREAGNLRLGSILDELGAIVNDASAEVQRLLRGRQGEMIPAGGPSPARSASSDTLTSSRMESRSGNNPDSGRRGDFDDFFHPNPTGVFIRPGQIASKMGYTVTQINDAIHAVKRDPVVRAAAGRNNPDIGIEIETGDVFIQLGGGNFSGDAIGNLFDHLPQ